MIDKILKKLYNYRVRSADVKEYEIGLEIDDEKYLDSLAIALIRQGYEVYYNKDSRNLCFKTYDEEVREIKH